MKIHCRKMRKKNMQIKFKMLTTYTIECKTWNIFTLFYVYEYIWNV